VRKDRVDPYTYTSQRKPSIPNEKLIHNDVLDNNKRKALEKSVKLK
jgi:hypothetical protein